MMIEGTANQALRVINTSPLGPIDAAMQRIFPAPQEETRMQKARRIMGEHVRELADEELEVFLTEFQYLIDGWFDSFERQVFDGLTLQQVLGQG